MKKKFLDSNGYVVVKASAIAVLILIVAFLTDKYLFIIAPIVLIFIITRNLISISVDVLQFKKSPELMNVHSKEETKFLLIKGLY